MELIDNITRLLGDDLKATLKPKARLKIAASCFSMYAFEALRAELEKIDDLSFIFTSPTFTASEVTDKIRKERKEFHIPKLDRERSLYGSEFEIQLRNKLTQRAIAKECADWMRRKARFKSNRTRAPMQPFAVVQANGADTAYMPLHGFTAVDLGYLQGNAVSNLVNKMDEPAFAATLKQADREKSLQALMTVNLLKRLESSVESFRLTLNALRRNHQGTLAKIAAFNQSGVSASVGDLTEVLANLEGDDDELPILDDDTGEIGGKVKISLGDMDLPSWERDLKGDLELIDTLLASMNKITPEDDAKLQHLKAHLLEKIPLR